MQDASRIPPLVLTRSGSKGLGRCAHSQPRSRLPWRGVFSWHWDYTLPKSAKCKASWHKT